MRPVISSAPLIQPLRLAAPTLMLVALLAGPLGCGRQEIAVYEVPHVDPHAGHNHDSHTPSAQGSPHGAGPSETPSWTLPEGWLTAGASDMLAGRIHIPGPDGTSAEVAVMPFKRMNELDFLNVLRSTMGLSPVEAGALPNLVESIDIAGTQGQLFDVTKDATDTNLPEDTHVLVAMLPRGETSWFFKLAGHSALVEANRDRFAAFLKSVEFKESTDPTTATTTTTAATASPTTPATPSTDRGLPDWTVPSHWKEVAPTTMLLAKFQTPGDTGPGAEITVSSFPGDVGGLLANVNRWRGQVGLSPLTESELTESVTPLEMTDGPASIVDMSGPGAEGDETRLIGVIHPLGNQTWFYKMMGPTVAAGAEKESFIQFVKSVRHTTP